MSVILSVLSMIVCPTANGMEVRAGDRPEAPLTVEQTLGAVFLGVEDHQHWNVFKRAEPEAKPGLYKILHNQRLEEFHSRAVLILGYIGDAEDAAKLEAAARKDSGTLTYNRGAAVAATFRSLGNMARRGVKEASQTLDKMATVDHWTPPRFQWSTTKNRLPAEYETLALVMAGYAVSGRNDLDERVAAIPETIEDPDVLRQMRFRIDPARLRDRVQRMHEIERKPITPYLYKAIQNVFNGDVENPGPAPGYRR